MAGEPVLSIVVTITGGSPNLGRCLRALETQRNPPALEILVPFYPGFDLIEDLAAAHPQVRFLPVTGPPPDPRDAGSLHLGYDRRRAAGLAATRGELVAMTEDHAIPAETWCADILSAHALPYAAIGGAIENRSSRALNRAAYFCDFGRYGNPLPEGPAAYLSDINLSYKRQALEAVRAVWRDHYHETYVHSAIQAAGGTLWRTPRIVAGYDRGELRLRSLLAERFAWARLFAGRRALKASWLRRAFWILGSPLLPVLLTARRAGEVLRRGRDRAAFASALPCLLLLMLVWTAGELTGYLTRRPVRRLTAGPQGEFLGQSLTT